MSTATARDWRQAGASHGGRTEEGARQRGDGRGRRYFSAAAVPLGNPGASIKALGLFCFVRCFAEHVGCVCSC